ncbi:hypothetical protein AK812_SmicGene13921 [Symbiodinium microadriaticum]|uniref:Uncharacterized protein n=1 Tax=Symbiodinium microadriaticum TaxID=2951 RepID=A0A1Q9E6U9_SYMMI|nr:hypothetical protein AK812_SmicGene13921 [Symbiodinium microadriaticum]CAE7038490.1 unnamed protein product [Symbiodinium sp. KB8]CAE7222278.1 unnamed protein product [Symbiodinium microadriaticum]
MDSFAEPWIPGRERDNTRSEQLAKVLQGVALTSLVTFAAQLPVLIAPELAAGASGPVLLASRSPPDFVMAVHRVDTLLAPYVRLITFVGSALFVSIYVINFIRFLKDFDTFTKMMERFHLPCPRVMAAGGLLFMSAGSAFYLTGIPIWMLLGTVLLLMFLIASTFFGHYKPWKQSNDLNHFFMMLKNIGMCGHCLATAGFELSQTGAVPDADTVGRSLHEMLEACWASFRPCSWILQSSGMVLFTAPFLFSCLHYTMDINQLVGMIREPGLGRCTARRCALLVVMLLLVSSFLYMSGVAILVELGALGFLSFLLVSTYFSHLKPYLQSGEKIHYLHIQKNLSLAGGCVMVLGVAISEGGRS